MNCAIIEFLFCWLTRVASGERCLKQLWPPRTQTQHLFSCTLCCSELPHHAVLCWVLTTLVSVHRNVLLPRHSCVAHSQCCGVAYYQFVQGNHTCSANNKILLFQSPCTGTRQCGQVISFFYFFCSNIYFFKKVKTTVKNELTSGFPDIAMITADTTRHGSIPVIGVSGQEKNANSESQDSCSLSRNIHLVILRCQGWDRGLRAFGSSRCWTRIKPHFHIGPRPGPLIIFVMFVFVFVIFILVFVFLFWERSRSTLPVSPDHDSSVSVNQRWF